LIELDSGGRVTRFTDWWEVEGVWYFFQLFRTSHSFTSKSGAHTEETIMTLHGSLADVTAHYYRQVGLPAIMLESEQLTPWDFIELGFAQFTLQQQRYMAA
jgi:hypothetical protein